MNIKDETVSICAHEAAMQDHEHKDVVVKERLEAEDKIADPKAKMLGTEDNEHSDVDYDKDITPERHTTKNIIESLAEDEDVEKILMQYTKDWTYDWTRDMIDFDDIVNMWPSFAEEDVEDIEDPYSLAAAFDQYGFNLSPNLEKLITDIDPEDFNELVFDRIKSRDECFDREEAVTEGIGTSLASAGKFIAAHWKEILSALETIGVSAEAVAEIANKIKEQKLTEDSHERKPDMNIKAAFNNALAIAKKSNKPVIYGYSGSNRHGEHRYFELEPIVCDDVASCADDIRKQYHVSGVVLVAYPDKAFAESLKLASRFELSESIFA